MAMTAFRLWIYSPAGDTLEEVFVMRGTELLILPHRGVLRLYQPVSLSRAKALFVGGEAFARVQFCSDGQTLSQLDLPLREGPVDPLQQAIDRYHGQVPGISLMRWELVSSTFGRLRYRAV